MTVLTWDTIGSMSPGDLLVCERACGAWEGWVGSTCLFVSGILQASPELLEAAKLDKSKKDINSFCHKAFILFIDGGFDWSWMDAGWMFRRVNGIDGSQG